MNENKALKEIGTRLERLREQFNYSREKMAVQCGLTKSGYYKNERGQSLPKLSTLERLSRNCDLSMDWLFFGKGPMLFNEKETQAKKVIPVENQQEEITAETAQNLEPVMPDVKDLLAHMEKDPLLRYKVLVCFYEYRKESEAN